MEEAWGRVARAKASRNTIKRVHATWRNRPLRPRDWKTAIIRFAVYFTNLIGVRHRARTPTAPNQRQSEDIHARYRLVCAAVGCAQARVLWTRQADPRTYGCPSLSTAPASFTLIPPRLRRPSLPRRSSRREAVAARGRWWRPPVDAATTKAAGTACSQGGGAAGCLCDGRCAADGALRRRECGVGSCWRLRGHGGPRRAARAQQRVWGWGGR